MICSDLAQRTPPAFWRPLIEAISARILITGGAGYKGLKLSQRLIEAGHEVTVLDNFMYGYEPCLFLFQYPNVRFVHRDIRALERTDVAPFDCIFHLVGISSNPACEAIPHSDPPPISCASYVRPTVAVN